jgi:RNA polymerase sigma-54 factor
VRHERATSFGEPVNGDWRMGSGRPHTADTMTVPAPRLALTPRLDLRVYPSLLTCAELLACPLEELDGIIARELESNPALDRVDRPGTGTGWSGEGLNSVPYRPGTAESLVSEVRPLLPEDDRWLAAWILADLDQRGFLGRDVRTLAADLGVDEARATRVIEAIRAVGPPGICAADVTDCLLLQLQPLEADGRAPRLLRTMITDHLPDLAKGRVGTVAAALGISSGEVLALRDFLRTHLRPWVALDAPAAGPVPASPPDIVIRRAPDAPREFEVLVTSGGSSLIRLDPLWAELAADTPSTMPPADRRRLREHLARARTFLAGLEERAATLLRVARHVAVRQRGFLSEGPIAHAPLTRAEVAAAVGLHESTVSRAVAGKRVRLPDGRVVPFASLFGASGSVQASLQAIVAAEPQPLSDAELADELRARGYPVARRTVAKYRGQLGIPTHTCR